MLYLLLIITILLLTYLAFFTPEKRNRRNIKKIQNLFNTPLHSLLEDESGFERSFMESCEQETSNANCVCTYNYLRNKLGFEKFYKDSKQFSQTGVIPESLREAMDEAKTHCTTKTTSNNK